MKPSFRINEIAKELFEQHEKYCFGHGYEECGYGNFETRSSALIKYLDEVYEKEQRNLEEKKEVNPDEMIAYGWYRCSKCEAEYMEHHSCSLKAKKK